MTPFLIAQIVLTLFVFFMLLNSAAVMVYVERKVAAMLQQRVGPTLVGPRGLLQPLADVVKLMFKEELRPRAADAFLFALAPIISATCAFAAFAVVPFGARTTLFGLIPGGIRLQVADVNVAILVVFAIASMSVYGIVLAGWSSGSKYALLGGLRSSAQMISYEVAMGMTLVSVMVGSGNVTLSKIIETQQQSLWFIFPLLLGFVMFLICSLAETNRLPFDLPETESELITGYHTEYSSMKFSMFFIAEYANLMTASAMMATLFFGGWDIPFTSWDQTDPRWYKSLLTMFVFTAKTLFFIFVFIWVRWTLPRFRFDQLMALGWKLLLPLALAYLMILAVASFIMDQFGIRFGVTYALVLFVINLVMVGAVMWGFDRGRIISPTEAFIEKTEKVA